MPDALGVRFAVEGLEQFPHDWYAVIIEVSLVGGRADVHFSVVSFERALKVGRIHVELSHT
eukprot:1908157-Pleurochrysis_carterae.AAC.1